MGRSAPGAMPALRVATFNVENIRLRRAHGSRALELTGARDEDVEDRANGSRALDVIDRRLTARLIRDANADVVALQEVFDRDALDFFHDAVLVPEGAAPYPHRALIDGNDGRGIDVGVLSRVPLAAVRSHAAATFADLKVAPPFPDWEPDTRIFRRDALEIDIPFGAETLTLYVVHFKAMGRNRSETAPVRAAEAMAVRRLIERRFAKPADALWMIVGDLNDHVERDGAPEPEHGLGAFFDDGFAVDLIARIADPRDRWTYHYAPLDIYAHPDGMLVSPALAARTAHAVPTILRAGMWRIATCYDGPRYEEVGATRPRASDHALAFVDLPIDRPGV